MVQKHAGNWSFFFHHECLNSEHVPESQLNDTSRLSQQSRQGAVDSRGFVLNKVEFRNSCILGEGNTYLMLRFLIKI
ncbi:hypothetical protein ACFX11_038000 [Malus domestica]